ncbi:MAG: hydroxymethylglutaryl-CoA reductase, degradative [Gammaproteobacteria bacterium]|nr:hydroxymethylglutaryl-CoA reductase, degradative [Gammaproteobacteria bacterium]
MDRSRIPLFYKMSIDERVRAVHEKGLVTDDDFKLLTNGDHTLKLAAADKMIENVIGVMGMPIGLGLNFLINERDYVVPLVVEEPSIVAALSAAAKTARAANGYKAESDDPILIGQIQIVEIPNIDAAGEEILNRKQEILDLANSFHPRMVARGGGAVDLEIKKYPFPSGNSEMLVLHLLVDTRDAMGANLVNGMCEGVASLIETITEGKVFLRILSNLADRSIARAEVTLPVEILGGRGYTGEQVRDGIIIASDFAQVDPYRAATHNKGIMNGVDAVALATGNDWRAIEAGAHAYAARDGRYTALSRWWKDKHGNLRGSLAMPLKVGTVGGPLESNPSVAVNLRMVGVDSATELAEVMAAVGLAQNYAALKALATEGIQAGHMTLHARSVVKAAGTPPELFDEVLEKILRSGDIKVWKAREILDDISDGNTSPKAQMAQAKSDCETGVGFGKIILLGEHSVVYGRHAIACPIPLNTRAHVEDCDDGVHLLIPKWGVEYQLNPVKENRRSFELAASEILEKLGLGNRGMRIEVFPDLPRGMGMGGSAALAVAVVRAIDQHFKLGLSADQINEFALESEKTAHGKPSGIDNTMATFGQPLVFRKGEPPMVELLNIPEPIWVVVGMTRSEGLTAKTVQAVREAHARQPQIYEKIFDDIDNLTLRGVAAIQENDMATLGELMNINQGLLNALQVSTPELEAGIQLARDSGALGAKLTGGGGGGAMLALCKNETHANDVATVLNNGNLKSMTFSIGGNNGETVQ